MNFTTMDPANQLLLILATAAAMAERIMTFCEWLARRRVERSLQKLPVSSTSLADSCELHHGTDPEVRRTENGRTGNWLTEGVLTIAAGHVGGPSGAGFPILKSAED
jgi:hypothetical protein